LFRQRRPDAFDVVGGRADRRGRVKIMLVLSRKKNESIVIRDDIVVTVVEIRADWVRLGIEAPKEVPVHRREVYESIKESDLEKDTTSEK
jgi:carbon storage regulator